MSFFRDCNSGTTGFDAPAYIGIYDLVTNAYTQCVTMSLSNSTVLQLGDACYNPSLSGVCVEIGYYEADVVIPDNPNGYYISYGRCCRNSIITNIQNPGGAGEMLYAEIPDPAIHNSTPVFGKFPKAYFCANNPNIDSLTCTDVDGDSLVYSLVTPMNGYRTGTAGNELSRCPDPGPYPDITWQTPYSLANIVGGSPAMAIDRNTGIITAKPSAVGVFVFCVRVEAYRKSDKKKMGEVRRDIQYAVTTCTPPAPPVFTSPTSNSISVKAGDTLSFPVIVVSNSNKDTITLSSTSVLFTNGMNVTFDQPKKGGGTVQSQFTFSPTCDDTGTYRVVFSANVSSVCLGNQIFINDTVDITVLPPDIPLFVSPIAFIIKRPGASDSTQSIVSGDVITINAGDELSAMITATSIDPYDDITLVGQSELFNGSYDASFASVNGYSSVQSAFRYGSACKDIRSGAYHVTFTVNHCYAKSTFDMDIIVKTTELDPIPNIFTPNGDKKNDYFQLKNKALNFNCDFSIKIFDRWGLLLFESTDVNFRWDGTTKGGSKAAEGVYYYIIEGYLGAEEYKRRGTVNIKL